jgi:hypothetical protein
VLEFFILYFHIVVDLEVYMDELLSLTLYHTREEMLEYFDIFAMHTNQDGTVWSLDSDIDVISYDVYSEAGYRDTESSPELSYERENYIFHNW